MEDMVVVVLGLNQDIVAEFKDHPRIKWIQTTIASDWKEIEAQIPPKPVIVLMTERVPYTVSSRLTNAQEYQSVLNLQRHNTASLRERLKAFLTPVKKMQIEEPVIEPALRTEVEAFTAPATKGHRTGLADFIRGLNLDYSKVSMRQAGKDVLEKANAAGFNTTLASIVQTIRRIRLDGTSNHTPSEVNPCEALDQALALVQHARDQIKTLTKRNAILEAKLAHARNLFNGT